MLASMPLGSSRLIFSSSARMALITSTVLALGSTYMPMKTAFLPENRTSEL